MDDARPPAGNELRKGAALGLALAVVLSASGCYQSHTPGTDELDGARRDAAVDARVSVDAGSGVCTTPRDGHCCCSGDALGRLACVGGAWRCEGGYSYHTGTECSPLCGGPCALPCPPDAGRPTVMCASEPSVFPTFDRSCMTPADCDIAPHQTDCCGSILFTGIAAYERMRFDVAEATCRAEYPACGCLGTYSADDGTTPSSGPEPYVLCTDNTCTTSYFVGG